ncbi:MULTISPECIES: hypothetical protein [Clostridium]|jgi:hypothetical protein|uniref:Glycerophosphoryl diester phosphodiesterase membrane domain-containing protein n=2 Tax=root TaxID=1 RepID=R9C4Q9_9CLOT|nr:MULTISPECIES: hypothetical protein [Clostridium]EOR24287.1 hypothetical protein A500_13056 [Clostridium sartagoforme AAU1]KLE17573.1 hypothetical protein AAT22_00010 [Clostridium sp. C8]
MEERKNYLSVSEILSKAFRISKDNILEILKVIGIFIVPTVLIIVGIIVGIIFSSMINMSYAYSYNYLENSIPFIGFGSVLILIFTIIIASAVIIYADAIIVKILDDANRGKEVSWKTANKYVWQKKWSVIGLNLLVALMLFAFFIALTLLTVLLSFLTIGIGLIILIPLIIAICVVMAPIPMLFNSALIVKDLTITEAIGETFLLFKRGYFWTTIGRLAAISGITIGLGIVLIILEFIPLLGIIIAIIGQFIIQVYTISYLNVLVYDRSDIEEIYIDPII